MSKARTLLIFVAILCCQKSYTQAWKITEINIGWKFFERQLVGTNPYTIVSQLKDPLPYINNLNSLPNNSLDGFPIVVGFDNYYAGMSIKKNNLQSRFWQRHSIYLGFVCTGVNEYPTGAISEITSDSPYTTRTQKFYRVSRKIQFFGMHAGLLRQFMLRKNLFFVSGLQGQISVAAQHVYRQIYDTVTFKVNIGFQNSSSEAEVLAGKNYLQWQLYIPIALEYHAFKNRVGIRGEINFGLLKNPFVPAGFANLETFGAGFMLSYRL